MKPRFSLRWFLAGVAYLAFGCAAFMQPDGYIATLFQTLCWAIIVGSVIAAIVHRKQVAIGFAVASLAYVVPAEYMQRPPNLGPHRLTLMLTEWAHHKAAPYLAARQAPPGFVPKQLDSDERHFDLGPNGKYHAFQETDWDQNQRTGSLAAAVLYGVAGAWLAITVTQRSNRKAP